MGSPLVSARVRVGGNPSRGYECTQEAPECFTTAHNPAYVAGLTRARVRLFHVKHFVLHTHN